MPWPSAISMSPRTRQVTALTVVLGSILVGFYQTYYEQYGQFYPAMRQFSRNNQAMVLAFAQWLGIVYLSTKGVIYMFFGDLRAIEYENVTGNLWLSITDIALTLMIFHRESEKEPVSFIILLSGLISIKAIHWLFHDRVDFMETSPVITWLFRIRMVVLTIFLIVLDSVLVYYAYEMVNKRKYFWLVFACEYGLLLTSSIHIFLKFILHSVDLASTSPWENKNMYMMYIRVVAGLIRFSIQLGFTYFLATKVTFPIYQLRPLLVEIRVAKNTIRDIVRSKKALKKMKSFPDATVANFTKDTDTTCIICHEDMIVDDESSSAAPKRTENSESAEVNVPKKLTGEIKKLPCSHMFHSGCLRSWFLRQQTCPICRASVLTAPTRPAANINRNVNNLNNLNNLNLVDLQEAQRIQNLIQNFRQNNNRNVAANENNRLNIFRNLMNGNNININLNPANQENNANNANALPGAAGAQAAGAQPAGAQPAGANTTSGNQGASPNQPTSSSSNLQATNPQPTSQNLSTENKQALIDLINNLKNSIEKSTPNPNHTALVSAITNLNTSSNKNTKSISKNLKLGELISKSSNKVPIPRPPVDIKDLMKLDKNELIAMEGDEKINIINRIEHLRNIRSMCDATITLMNQYEDLEFKKPKSNFSKKSSNDSSNKERKKETELNKIQDNDDMRKFETFSEEISEISEMDINKLENRQKTVKIENVEEGNAGNPGTEGNENKIKNSNEVETNSNQEDKNSELRRRRIEALSK